MMVFIAAFFVSSNGCLPTALDKGVDTDASSVQIHVGNSNELSPDGMTMLDVQVTLEATDFEEAGSSADRVLRVYLDSLTLLTTFRFKIEGLRAVLDATPGLVDRRCIVYRHFPAADGPLDGLDTEVLVGGRVVQEVNQPPIVRRAMRWFAIAVRANTQTSNFNSSGWRWNSLPNTRSPLRRFRICARTAVGRCFAWLVARHPRIGPCQAIRDLFVKIAKSDGEKLFEVCDEIRNVLMHGDDLHGLLASKRLNLSRIVDSLGSSCNVRRCAMPSRLVCEVMLRLFLSSRQIHTRLTF